LVQGESGSLLLDGITITLGEAVTLEVDRRSYQLEDHPRAALAAWSHWLVTHLQSLLDALAGRTLELIQRH
jgi:hypothetical protein